MKYITEFPHPVRHIENTWIPMRDGARLAARIWMPEDAETRPVPAVLEYIPYRKRDWTRVRDSMLHPFVAGHGYAAIRVDMRGSGDSEGVLEDEYIEQEQLDGLDVLAWLEAQPWCTGSVGMIGISWGGFNGLQIAALQPPQLKALITLCSTDDRYADDVHYMGGCLLGDNLSWASTMFAYTSDPPDPEIVGPAWRELWMHRLEGSGLWLDNWLRHQRRDEYWQHGSVCEDFSRINIPVYAVSGWADGYSNAVFRLLQGLDVPRKGLIGPWSHKYPDLGLPGPAIGFLRETLRWWDRWLKGIETGIEAEPMLRVWMLDSVPPTTHYKTRPGRWVAEPSWPTANIVEESYSLMPTRALQPAGAQVPHQPLPIQSPLSVGLFAGKWCSYSAPPDLPHDQREEDGGALVFDSDPLDEPLEILGAPTAQLELSADRPVAMIALRLSDIAPDGKATRITYGVLNLTHRDSHEHPQPLEPGRRYNITLRMNHVAQVFPKGHRFRLAVSSSYWPLAWPPPKLACLTIYTGESRLIMPRRPPRDADQQLHAFSEPELAPPLLKTMIEPPEGHWTVTRDLARDVSLLEVVKDSGVFRLEEIDLEIKSRALEHYTVGHDDLDSLKGRTHWIRRFRRGDWKIETHTHTVLTSDQNYFRIRADLDAYENDYRVYCHTWDRRIPRDLV